MTKAVMVQFLFLSGLLLYFERYFNFGKHESKNLTYPEHTVENNNVGITCEQGLSGLLNV